jgi:hypothetical protein
LILVNSPSLIRCVLRRMGALTTAAWHNDQSGQPVKRSRLAYDHWTPWNRSSNQAGLFLPPGTGHPSAGTGGVSMAWPIFRGLFDDASLFPPALLPMADAVAGHQRHQTAWYREMSGPFVCADTKITELRAALTAAGVAELDLALVLPGGAPAAPTSRSTTWLRLAWSARTSRRAARWCRAHLRSGQPASSSRRRPAGWGTAQCHGLAARSAQ